MQNNKPLTENERKIRRGEQFADADTLYAPVEYAAKLFPKNVALRFLGKNIPYAVLRKNVEKYAACFTAAGLKRGEAVTFALPNIPESVYILYAAAKAGLRIAPLHPLASPEAVRVAMQKSGGRLVFALGDGAREIARACPFAVAVAVSPANALGVKNALYCIKHPLPKREGNLVRLRDFLRDPAALPLSAPPSDCPAHAETSILLQSGGTTGTPKVIGLSAQAVNDLARRGLGILGREKGTDCGMLSVLPVFHGFGLAMGVHAMLCHGGKNVIFPKFHRASAVKEIRKGNVQFLIGVPRLYEALLSHPRFCGKALRSMVVAFVGGDFVSHTLLKNFDRHVAQYGGTCRLLEGYGLTETVTVCAVNTAMENRDETVGKPLVGIEIAAFDFSQDPPALLPADEKGELAVSGDTLMTEYVADESATNAVFFMHNGKRYVRTGDCGYTDSDGFVHFVSRFKRIIKVRGIPVYPMEIEQLTVAQAGVEDACVVPEQDKNGAQKIVLFVQTRDRTLKDALPALIREKISEFAVPDEVVICEQFPLTNVSKIDTNKLLQNRKREAES
ncbi:MAG: acyl--CoA ligase [Clostridiales bacterium]|nr:acyl--CoA ligase [Clostridiales bacterium]